MLLRWIIVIVAIALCGGVFAGGDASSPLHRAAANGDIAEVKRLIEGGADVDAKIKDGHTPLFYAAGAGETETVLALVRVGADIDIKTNDGWTPLHFAASQSRAETVLALIKAGAYLKATTNSGHTALDIARINKHWNIVKILENPPRPNPDFLNPPKPPSGESAPNVGVAPAPDVGGVAERVFENAWRSVVLIENNKGQGSGVIIKPNIVATNCHVVDGGGIVVYKAQGGRTDKSRKYPATIRRRDDGNDFCLLDVAGLFGVPADVRRYDGLRVGESVYGIGAPKGLDLSLSTGVISNKRAQDGIRIIQTDVAISPGSSGGGLFDREGNLVGILTAKIVDEDTEGIAFAIPADLALQE